MCRFVLWLCLYTYIATKTVNLHIKLFSILTLNTYILCYLPQLDSDDPRCKYTPFNDVEGLNNARQSLIDTTVARCKPENSDYTITLPAVAQPLGNLVCLCSFTYHLYIYINVVIM